MKGKKMKKTRKEKKKATAKGVDLDKYELEAIKLQARSEAKRNKGRMLFVQQTMVKNPEVIQEVMKTLKNCGFAYKAMDKKKKKHKRHSSSSSSGSSSASSADSDDDNDGPGNGGGNSDFGKDDGQASDDEENAEEAGGTKQVILIYRRYKDLDNTPPHLLSEVLAQVCEVSLSHQQQTRLNSSVKCRYIRKEPLLEIVHAMGISTVEVIPNNIRKITLLGARIKRIVEANGLMDFLLRLKLPPDWKRQGHWYLESAGDVILVKPRWFSKDVLSPGALAPEDFPVELFDQCEVRQPWSLRTAFVENTATGQTFSMEALFGKPLQVLLQDFKLAGNVTDRRFKAASLAPEPVVELRHCALKTEMAAKSGAGVEEADPGVDELDPAISSDSSPRPKARPKGVPSVAMMLLQSAPSLPAPSQEAEPDSPTQREPAQTKKQRAGRGRASIPPSAVVKTEPEESATPAAVPQSAKTPKKATGAVPQDVKGKRCALDDAKVKPPPPRKARK